MSDDMIAMAKASYLAFAAKDRAALEALLADDFRFTSPLDNRLDRATYFARCWPNSETLAAFAFDHVAAQGEQVFITYEATTIDGKRFRNTEIMTIRQNRIVEVEVYFGWSLPHEAPAGGFVDSSA